MNMLRIGIAAFLIALTVSGSARGQDGSYQPQAGELHPGFVLPRIDNREPVTLSAYRGKKVLLIHFASW